MMQQGGGTLDRLVRVLLPWLDARNIALLCILVVPLLCWIRYRRTGQRTTLQELLNAVLGAVMICSGVTGGLVLMFTRPLAVDLLSPDTAILAGLATLFASVALGWKNLRSVLLLEEPQVLEESRTPEVAPASKDGDGR